MEATTSRPTVVTVIGWLFVGYGAIGILGSLMAVVWILLLRKLGAAGFPGMQGEGSPLAAMTRASGSVVLQSLGRLLVSALVIVTAAGFLRLRPWSRAALEVFSWLAAAYTVISGVIAIRWVPHAMGGMRQAQMPPEFERVFAVGTIGISVVMMMVMVTVYALAIWALRLPAVRQAMSGGQAQTAGEPSASA